MSSPPSTPLTAFRKKNSQNSLSFVKKSHSFIKQHSFYRESSDRDDQSQGSSESRHDHPQNDPKIIWKQEEDLQLIALFKQVGANWQQMNSHLAGKSVFEIKRHFGKILRKVISNLNKSQREKGQKQINLKRIKLAMEATSQELDQSFNKNGQEVIIRDEIFELIHQFLTNKDKNQLNSSPYSIHSVRSILAIFKRSRKKKYGSKASTDIYFKPEIQSDQMERGYASDSSSVFEQPQQAKQSHKFGRNHDSFYADEESLSLSDQVPSNSNGVIVEQSQDGIKDLLRESGVLEIEELAISSSKNISINCQESIASSSQNLNNESYQHFCTFQPKQTRRANLSMIAIGKKAVVTSEISIEAIHFYIDFNEPAAYFIGMLKDIHTLQLQTSQQVYQSKQDCTKEEEGYMILWYKRHIKYTNKSIGFIVSKRAPRKIMKIRVFSKSLYQFINFTNTCSKYQKIFDKDVSTSTQSISKSCDVLSVPIQPLSKAISKCIVDQSSIMPFFKSRKSMLHFSQDFEQVLKYIRNLSMVSFQIFSNDIIHRKLAILMSICQKICCPIKMCMYAQENSQQLSSIELLYQDSHQILYQIYSCIAKTTKQSLPLKLLSKKNCNFFEVFNPQHMQKCEIRRINIKMRIGRKN